MNELKLVVIVPVYKEEFNSLGELFCRLRDSFKPISVEPCIVAIDDGNDDCLQTFNFLRGIADVVIRHSKNRGYTASVITGFNTALARGADFVLKLDADGQYAPECIEAMWSAMTEGVQVVSGSRYHHNSQEFNRDEERYDVNRLVVQWLLNRGVSVTDPFTGYRLFRREGLEALLPQMGDRICEYGYGLSLETTLQIATLGLGHVEVACPLYYPKFKKFPGQMADSEWRLKYYAKMIDSFISGEKFVLS